MMNVHFLQISDTHWSRSPIADGIDPGQRMDRLCRWIQSLDAPIDFIVHTGDLVHRGHIEGDDGSSTEQVVSLLRSLPYPVHCVVGNHDHRAAWPRILGSMPGDRLPCYSQRWAYHFQLRNERFFILDGRDDAAIDPRGMLGEAQIESLSSVLASTSEPATVFVHYPPLPLECDWIDRTMLLIDGDELHRVLAKHRNRVRGVFFGHVHRAVALQYEGVLYASTGGVALHFPNLPMETSATPQSDPIAFANYVCVGDSGTLLKTQWVQW
jgi:3',5'-cyclic AMP phosphodiesterase CpdA